MSLSTYCQAVADGTLAPAALVDAQRHGVTVLDTRGPEAFAGGHVPGAVNVGLDGAFPTWAGTVLAPDDPVVLVLDDPAQLWTRSGTCCGSATPARSAGSPAA